ncbi:MAG TPA: hypothetical protein VL020_06590, partial [Pseudomonadales bacterium]|nr:hypothetical protein [Pseudomonadales bacterium]
MAKTDQVNAWVPYAEEIRVIRFTCAFCSCDEDFERSDFSAKTKAEAVKVLIDEGWEELTADSLEGLACPAC